MRFLFRIVAVASSLMVATTTHAQIVRWAENAPGATQKWVDGNLVKTIDSGAMEVTATLRDVPNKMFMSVIGVTNRSGKVADVVPFTFTVQIMDPVGPQRQALAPERALLNWTDGTGRTEQFNQTISQFALRANSVNPNASISGGVWFPRDKDKFREVLIRIPLAGMVYEFPFYFQVR